MTKTHQSETILAHALGVKHEDTMRGLFDDWHACDMACLRLQLAFLRENAMEGEEERRQLRFSRNHWRLAAAIMAGIVAIAVWAR